MDWELKLLTPASGMSPEENNMICPKCNEKAIENMANWKTFFYCQKCKEEVIIPDFIPAEFQGHQVEFKVGDWVECIQTVPGYCLMGTRWYILAEYLIDSKACWALAGLQNKYLYKTEFPPYFKKVN